MDTGLEDTLILTDTGSTNTSMDLDAKVVSESTHDLLDLLSKLSGGSQDESLALDKGEVELLQDTRAESGGFASTRLSLLDHIKTLAKGNDSSLLNSRRLFKTIGIDTPKKVLLQTHGIKALMDLIIGGEELILSLKDFIEPLVKLTSIELGAFRC